MCIEANRTPDEFIDDHVSSPHTCKAGTWLAIQNQLPTLVAPVSGKTELEFFDDLRPRFKSSSGKTFDFDAMAETWNRSIFEKVLCGEAVDMTLKTATFLTAHEKQLQQRGSMAEAAVAHVMRQFNSDLKKWDAEYQPQFGPPAQDGVTPISKALQAQATSSGYCTVLIYFAMLIQTHVHGNMHGRYTTRKGPCMGSASKLAR